MLLRATLLGERPFSGEARVGVAFIAESDRIEWEEARRAGEHGAGPARLEDLANVRDWLTAPVKPEPHGGGTLGPVPVPLANRYRLLAWEQDGTFYWGDLVPEGTPHAGVLDAGALRATAPTGLRVRLTGTNSARAPGRFLLSLSRVVDPADVERTSELLPVVAMMAPKLASALQDETPLPLSPEQEMLLQPLLPDPAISLRVRSEAGRESEPVEVPLREGRVETVVLDLDRLFPEGGGGTTELRGRLLLGTSDRPPPGVHIERVDPTGPTLEPGPDGRFTVPGLPSWRASRFAAVLDPVASGRPLAPGRWEFEFTPDTHAPESEKTWRMPAYRWLVLRMDAFSRGQLELRAHRPYPVFLLQHREAQGWRVQAAEEFLHEEGNLAVSLLEPGTYRVLVAASPYELYESPSVDVAEGDTERSVTLSLREQGAPCEVQVHSATTGEPIFGALVTVAGVHGSLPPAQGHTDVEGRWQLGQVHASSLHIEVEQQGTAPWSQEAMDDCRRSGVVNVRL